MISFSRMIGSTASYHRNAVPAIPGLCKSGQSFTIIYETRSQPDEFNPASLAAAANSAIAAKAKIGSPSKITTYYGKMEGLGFINGMKNMKRNIARTAGKVFEIKRPNNTQNMPMPDKGAFYGTDPEITTILAIDGRKFAKATSRNIRNQQSVDARRENRKVGVV